MAWMALGFTTPDGDEPALEASRTCRPWIFVNASAIWLRLEFSVHTNRTLFIGWIVGSG